MSARIRTNAALSLVAAGGLAAWALAQGPPPPAPAGDAPPPRLVRVAELSPRTHRFRVRTHGTVAPRTESDLVTEVAGRVIWASPSLVAGGFFAAGERLLEIDRRDYENTVARAKARVARAESELRLAAAERARHETLAAREAISASALDRARNTESVARAVLDEARADLERAVLDLARTRLVAPYAGRVREKQVGVGQFARTGTPVARVYAVDSAEVRLPVHDADLAFLELPAETLDDGRLEEADHAPEVVLRARFAGSTHTWPARVVRTEGEIDARTRMLHLVARVEDPFASHSGRMPLAVGLFVEAEILGREVEDVLVVPRAAVRDGNSILVVDASNRLRVRPARVLRNEGERAIVRAPLAAGERLCLSVLERPVEGARVRPVAAAPPEAAERPRALARRAP